MDPDHRVHPGARDEAVRGVAAAPAGRVEEDVDADAPGIGNGWTAQADGLRRSAAESGLRLDPAGPDVSGAGDFAMCLGAGPSSGP